MIDRLLAPYSSSGWLIGQKSKALLMANALILAAVGIDALLSLVLFGIHLGSIMGDLAIFVGVSSSSYLLLRGRYFPAASLGIGAALVAVVVVRLLNTGTFSLDSSYDVTQMALNLVIVIFFSGLFAERPVQLAGTTAVAMAIREAIFSKMKIGYNAWQ